MTLADEVGKGAGAYWMRKRRRIWLRPRVICKVGCETPTINYQRCNGKKYRYFYAITADVDDPESAGKIYKVDVVSGEVKQWWQEGVYCAEPMFVQRLVVL